MFEDRDRLASVVSRDARYPIDAYEFVLEAIASARSRRRRARLKPRGDKSAQKPVDPIRKHVTGRDVCDLVKELAVEKYGFMARMMLDRWGLQTTSHIGDIVYNLIDAGELEKNEADARSDFDDVFDLHAELERLQIADLNQIKYS
jgi:uncharacterized repeat protein (TIGR04138 family)